MLPLFAARCSRGVGALKSCWWLFLPPLAWGTLRIYMRGDYAHSLDTWDFAVPLTALGIAITWVATKLERRAQRHFPYGALAFLTWLVVLLPLLIHAHAGTTPESSFDDRWLASSTYGYYQLGILTLILVAAAIITTHRLRARSESSSELPIIWLRLPCLTAIPLTLGVYVWALDAFTAQDFLLAMFAATGFLVLFAWLPVAALGVFCAALGTLAGVRWLRRPHLGGAMGIIAWIAWILPAARRLVLDYGGSQDPIGALLHISSICICSGNGIYSVLPPFDSILNTYYEWTHDWSVYFF